MARGSQSISEFNAVHKEKRKMPMEQYETQLLRAHKKSFLKYLHDIGIAPLQCQKLGKLYDALVYHGKKESNIMQVYPHPMSTFVEHFAEGTLHLLRGSATIHTSNTRKLAADPDDIKRNPKPR